MLICKTPLNTPFPFPLSIFKPHYLNKSQLRTLFVKLAHCSFKTPGVLVSGARCRKSNQMASFHIQLRTAVPFVIAHLEIFHGTHHPVIPESDLCFTFCSTLNALSKRTSK